MNVLIDTNIFISREDYKQVPPILSSLLRLFEETSVKILVHPMSKEDIKRDLDVQRKEISLSKISAYPELTSPPASNEDAHFIGIVGSPRTGREMVDNELLYAIYKDASDFLITSDTEILRKADKTGIGDRVFNVEEALEFFKTQFVHHVHAPTPAIRLVPVYNLSLSDPIFDSLKADYSEEFEIWWQKISREGRKAWISQKADNSLGALLILKEENEPIDSIPPLGKRRRLKISTLIVKHMGQKIGELFLKLAINHAIENNINEIYLTHYVKPNDELVRLVHQYGFIKVARKNNGEDVFSKFLKPTVRRKELEDLPPVELNRKYYPSFYDGPRVRKHVIPIRPEYHDRLFIEYRYRTPGLMEAAGELIVEGNTIKKAYICHARSRKLDEGDVLVFYRSRDQVLTSVCSLDKIFRDVGSYEEVMKLVGKRTVYLKDELINLVSHGPVMIILFLLHFELKNYITLTKLQKARIMLRSPQSVVEISDERYRRILNIGGLDEHFTLH
jgi:predicted nucleic acid-binding protein